MKNICPIKSFRLGFTMGMSIGVDGEKREWHFCWLDVAGGGKHESFLVNWHVVQPPCNAEMGNTFSTSSKQQDVFRLLLTITSERTFRL